ncbi:hypothetical protein D3C80_121520 [compost metagenome]
MKPESNLEEALDELYKKNVALLSGITSKLDQQAQKYVIPAVATTAVAMMTGYIAAATVGVAGTPQEEIKQVLELYSAAKGVPSDQVTLGDVVKAVISGEFNSLAIAAPTALGVASASAGVMLLAQRVARTADSLLDKFSGDYHKAKMERMDKLYAILKEDYKAFRNMEPTKHLPISGALTDPRSMLKHILLNQEGSLRNYDEVISRNDSMSNRLKMQ